MRHSIFLACFWCCLMSALMASAGYAAIIIDHTCVDLDQVPSAWIDQVKSNWRWHYAHTSHGEQLTIGLGMIESENSFYNVEVGYSYLPSDASALCVFDGQEDNTYITPDLYWETEEGRQRTRDVLNHNPSINISQWGWCGQCEYYDSSQIQDYLNQMSAFEAAFPGVTFVYMTGNAQAYDEGGYQRSLNNAQIRNFCVNNNKILFDFEDLDAWWYNPGTSSWEFSSYEYDGHTVPVQHSHYDGDEAAHTTYESCRQKGLAAWWMLARIAGWGSGAPTPTPGPTNTPAPTPTPGPCDNTGVTLWMPDSNFTAGEQCSCSVTVCNNEGYWIEGYPLFVILEIWGEYYFAPGFSSYENYLDQYYGFDTGNTVIEVIPSFAWPAGVGSGPAVIWYAALTDSEITELFGAMDTFEWTWSE